MVWREGLDQWVAAGTLQELSGLFVSTSNFTKGNVPPPATPVNNPYYQPQNQPSTQPYNQPTNQTYQQPYHQPTVQPAVFASFGERAVAIILDGFILVIPIFLFSAIAIVVFGMGEEYMEDIQSSSLSSISAIVTKYNWIFSLVQVVIVWTYEAVMYSSKWQATVGKRVMGLVVVDDQGNRLSFLNALGRAMVKSFSGIICYIGYFVMLFSEKHQTLHDSIAKTLVLKDTK
jgi:uncharacterized RDD family membrane protein YckC